MSDPQNWLEAANLVGLVTPQRPRPRLITPDEGAPGFLASPSGLSPYTAAFNQMDQAAGVGADSYHQGFGATLIGQQAQANEDFMEAINTAFAELGEEGAPEPGSQAALEASRGGRRSSSLTGPGAPAGSGGTGWEVQDQWNAGYEAAAVKTGVPGNVIKAIQGLETGRADLTGKENCEIRPEAGCLALNTGIFETTAESYGLNFNRIVNDPEYAIYATGVVLSGLANSDASQWGGPAGQSTLDAGGWEGVARVYFGGKLDGGFTDELGRSGATYGSEFTTYLEQLGGEGNPAPVNDAPPGEPVHAVSPVGSVSAMPDIWGGTDEVITQGIGDHSGEVYNGNPHIYDYCRDMGIDGHCGVDIGLAVGTQIVAPITGTVVSVSNEYFSDPYGVGEIRLQAPNGDIIILGHMRTADVRPGEQITVGQPLGTSGQSDSRPESAHLHLEVRVLKPDGSYGIADPETYFGQPLQSAPVEPTRGRR